MVHGFDYDYFYTVSIILEKYTMNESKSTRFSFVFPEEINESSIKDKFSSIVAELFWFSKDVDQKMQVLREKIEFWRENIQKQIVQQYNLRDDVINLDVRGRIFTAPKVALVNRFGSYFHALLCSPNSCPAANGRLIRYRIFLNRDINSINESVFYF